MTITIVFTTPPQPGTEQHETEVVRKYFEPKGIVLEAGNIIRV